MLAIIRVGGVSQNINILKLSKLALVVEHASRDIKVNEDYFFVHNHVLKLHSIYQSE